MQPAFTADCTKKWREFFQPITERSNVDTKQIQIAFDTQYKTTLTNRYQVCVINYEGESNILYDTKNHYK